MAHSEALISVSVEPKLQHVGCCPGVNAALVHGVYCMLCRHLANENNLFDTKTKWHKKLPVT